MSRLQPRPKSLATSNISSHSANASNDTVPRVVTPVYRTNTRLPSADPLSERATSFLIRRTLCSQLVEKGRGTPAPIEDLLPPLTSSNEVDLELYAFISIIIREFVQIWYAKITPDHVFVEEVVKIIAHCTRALEQRLRNVDLESLLLDELPDLLEIHFKAHQASYQSLYPYPIETNPRQIYHSLCPFPALSPVPDGKDQAAVQFQMENEAAYRELLVQGVLAVLLPTEDLENDCLTTLVGQIFSEMILGGGIGGKASEPWLLWDGLTKVVEVIQTKISKPKAQVNHDDSYPLDVTEPSTKPWRFGWSIQKHFWQLLQYIFLAFTAIRFIIIALATSSSLPSRIVYTRKMSGVGSKDGVEPLANMDSSMTSENLTPLKQPILNMKIWSCASSLLDLDGRMPWLNATLSMLQWVAIAGPGMVGNTDGRVDKILSQAIRTHVLDPTLLPTLLRSARAALFPNNAPAPPRLIPSAPEQLLIRQRCAEAILSLIPGAVQEIYFGAGEQRRIKEIENVLDMFGDSYCNKHLLYGIVELVIVRLMPELAEKGVEELLAERLS